jgi:microcystin-dependent protein
VPVHQGQGPGLTNRTIGEASGTETTTLTTAQMPTHNHGVDVTAGLHGETALADKRNPLGAMLATPPAAAPIYADPVAADDKLMASESLQVTAEIQPAGGSQPFNNMQPYLTVSFCIALQGIFPSRN